MITAPHMDASPGWLIDVLDELYRRTEGTRYGMSRAQFDAMVVGVADKYLPVDWRSDHLTTTTFLRTLHVPDLVLTRECAHGNEAAWNDFLTRFRPTLYSAARSMAGDESQGRELADALYADLYGTAVRDGARVSKLNSYTGRGSLAGWLRAVLARQHVDRYRKRHKEVSFEEKVEAGAQFAAPPQAHIAPPDIRVGCAIDRALAALTSQERFILATYYLDEKTLAQIAAMLGIHESTVSRKIERMVKQLNKHIREDLTRGGMSRRQAEEAMAVDVRDVACDFNKMRASKDQQQYSLADYPGKNNAQDSTAQTFQAKQERE